MVRNLLAINSCLCVKIDSTYAIVELFDVRTRPEL
jgi:hypothetical protein